MECVGDINIIIAKFHMSHLRRLLGGMHMFNVFLAYMIIKMQLVKKLGIGNVFILQLSQIDLFHKIMFGISSTLR